MDLNTPNRMVVVPNAGISSGRIERSNRKLLCMLLCS